MTHLDLFSGIGGFALAASWVWGREYHNIGHSEIEPFACKVYHKHFPQSECLGDIKKIKYREGQANLITGGFPCQPHSVAGKKRGSADERDLWSECVRAIRGVRPLYALFENVPGLFTSNGGRFFNRVLSDLVSIGYDSEWHTLYGYNAGIPQTRERIFLIAYPAQSCSHSILHKNTFNASCYPARLDGEGRGYAHINDKDYRARSLSLLDDGRWQGEIPNRERSGTNDGIPDRVDRLKSLGNAIVPQVAAMIFHAIKDSMIPIENRGGER